MLSSVLKACWCYQWVKRERFCLYRLWQVTSKGGRKIDSKTFRSESATHHVFEDLFNANMLGSRWLTYEELEELYQNHKILEADERITIHAQEFSRSVEINNEVDFDF